MQWERGGLSGRLVGLSVRGIRRSAGRMLGLEGKERRRRKERKNEYESSGKVQ